MNDGSTWKAESDREVLYADLDAAEAEASHPADLDGPADDLTDAEYAAECEDRDE